MASIFRFFVSLFKLFKAKRRKKLGKYNDLTKELFSSAAENSGLVFSTFYDNYLKYLWDTEGASDRLLEKYEYAVSKLFWPSARLLSRYCLVLNDLGNTHAAIEKFYEVKRLSPNIFNEYLAINAQVAYHEGRSDKYTELYKKIKENELLFEEMVRKNRSSFCVVGNSPCELNSGKGEYIDSKNLVIRFNNFSTSSPYDKDYGTKTNIWVRTPEGSKVRHRNITDFDIIMFTDKNYLNADKRWQLIRRYVLEKAKVGFFPPKYWYELVSILNAPPSAGILTLFTIYKILGPIKKEDVLGFSFTDQLEEATKVHYFDNASAGIRHNWQAERRLFESLLN